MLLLPEPPHHAPRMHPHRGVFCVCNSRSHRKKNFLAALGVEQYDVAAPLRCSAAARATIPSLRNSIPLLYFALLRRYLPTSKGKGKGKGNGNSACTYTALSTHYHKRVATCSYTHSVHTVPTKANPLRPKVKGVEGRAKGCAARMHPRAQNMFAQSARFVAWTRARLLAAARRSPTRA